MRPNALQGRPTQASPLMPASIAKDSFTAIWLHPIPDHLSIKEFSAKIEAQTDSLLALPSAQTNILKYDLMIPNNKLDTYFKALGFPDPQPVVLAKIECEVRPSPSYAVRVTVLTTGFTRAQNIARRCVSCSWERYSPVTWADSSSLTQRS
ncbi:hypothetical protein B0H16DRAFT_182598 [Mycena metata]|uniref:Uncharacterized protein n=1 Tax=Mycena metata TaxID=1033252 RepID=A0AAD7MT33_9AGAR|nr:hypothetical protein B0H16DRAFT_182598 [Mycena metata]